MKTTETIKDTDGWNVVDLKLPCFGHLMIAFKGDTIRIRKASEGVYLNPIEYKFPRTKKRAKENLRKHIEAEIDY